MKEGLAVNTVRDPKVKNAIFLGTLCAISYLAVYIARNILGAVTPQMVASGDYTNEFIGSLSSLYFITYAIGQLINGVLGDRIKARNMISFGLILAGICNFVFPRVQNGISVQVVYAAMGFFLAMIYAPMTKVVAENTEPVYAVRCSLGYTISAFLGSPTAGLLAAFMVWQSTFEVSAAFLVGMGVISFAAFLGFEKRGVVKYRQFEKGTREKKDGVINELLRRNIVAYTIISVVTGVIRTTVIFWLPTYLTDYLSFSPKMSASIYSASTFIICFSAFFSIFVYEKLRRKMELSMLIMFVAATAFFVGAYFVDLKTVNIIFIGLAIFFNNSATTVLWSIYCPSLKDTGVVSSVTGFLDFISYVAAAVSSTLFANSVSAIGWGNLILVWTALMAGGTVTSLVIFRKAIKNDLQQHT